MKNNKINKITIFSTFLILSFFVSFNVFAATEISWPSSPMGTGLTDYQSTTLPTLVQYFYEWGISIGALAAFVSIVVAGFKYLTSTGNTAQIGEAKKRIAASFFGLALLLSTYLILNTINPALTSLDINVNELDDNPLEGYSFVDYELTSECAYAKLYKDAEEMKQDKKSGYKKTSGTVVGLAPGGNYSKTDENDKNIYNAVKFFSKALLNKKVTTYTNGVPDEKPSTPLDPEDPDYPEGYKRLLIDGGDGNYYIEAMGTECKMYLYYEDVCGAVADLWGGVANVTYSTNNLADNTTANPKQTLCYKLVKN